MIIFTLAKMRLIDFTKEEKIICKTFDDVQYFCRIKSMAVLSAVGGIKEASAGMTQGKYNNICAFVIQEL